MRAATVEGDNGLPDGVAGDVNPAARLIVPADLILNRPALSAVQNGGGLAKRGHVVALGTR